MSYIQIDIGGKTRGLKFNQLAIELMAQYNDSETTTSIIYAMVYAGLRGNDYVKRIEPDYTFEQVCDWVDTMENKQSNLDVVAATLNESQSWKSLVKDGKELIETDESKKKV
jgi:hypothetical protein